MLDLMLLLQPLLVTLVVWIQIISKIGDPVRGGRLDLGQLGGGFQSRVRLVDFQVGDFRGLREISLGA